jgi:hypothetical protein
MVKQVFLSTFFVHTLAHALCVCLSLFLCMHAPNACKAPSCGINCAYDAPLAATGRLLTQGSHEANVRQPATG